MNKIAAAAFMCALNFASAQKNFSVAFIPDSLKENATAVIRRQTDEFEILSEGKAKSRHHSAVTIMNAAADGYAFLQTGYGKLYTLDMVVASVYDKDGNLIKNIPRKSFSDQLMQGSDFIGDDRVVYADAGHKEYPYTVEFIYENTYKGLLGAENWRPVNNEKISVQYASFDFKVPPGYTARFQEYNTQNLMEEAKSGAKTYTWHLKNFKAVKSEDYSPSLTQQGVPTVLTAPSAFEMEGYKGNMETWDGFGQWFGQLNAGRLELPDEAVQEVKKLTEGLPDERAKTKKIYEYLQSKTRYVSIQLGIGGWQPFPASFVREKGYGDCKALTNYTQAMLQAVGIASQQALVRAGDDARPINASFPSTQFNHVILCVPLAKDTVWLECTSQTQAFGYNGDFTGDREVLLIGPEGGKLARTKSYSKTDNMQARKAEIAIDEAGNAKVLSETLYRALQERDRESLAEQPEEVQKEWLYKKLGLGTFTLNSFSLKRNKEGLPFTTETLDLNISGYASVSGARLFVEPNMFSQNYSVPEKTEGERRSQVKRTSEYIDIDTMVYQIPAKYKLENLPKDVDFKNRYGHYKAKFSFQGGKLLYIRRAEMNKGLFPKESYEELREFFKQASKADKAKVVFVETIKN